MTRKYPRSHAPVDRASRLAGSESTTPGLTQAKEACVRLFLSVVSGWKYAFPIPQSEFRISLPFLLQDGGDSLDLAIAVDAGDCAFALGE